MLVQVCVQASESIARMAKTLHKRKGSKLKHVVETLFLLLPILLSCEFHATAFTVTPARTQNDTYIHGEIEALPPSTSGLQVGATY